MRDNTGRNDPCPCGSGKKYKHCHLRADDGPGANVIALRQSEHENAVQRATDWLTSRHRKAYQAAFDAFMDDLWSDEGAGIDIEPEFVEMLAVNGGEWLLSRGEMLIKGELRGINAYLLSDAGPGFNAGQRHWIAELAEQPLRLYTVTDVRVGDGLTLVDALDAHAEPLVVQERSGSRTARPGMLIGARVMRLSSHLELSGAVYPFAKLREAQALARVRATLESGLHSDNIAALAEMAVVRAWVAQWQEPLPLPDMRDTASGEALLLVTDHYRVLNAAALTQALQSQGDVSGDAAQGWRRELQGKDGLVRSLAAINPGKHGDRIEVFYRTQTLADQGRVWFDSLVGATVQFLTREITDPKGAISAARLERGPSAPPRAPDLPPEVMEQALEQFLRRTYANWANEAIPALSGQTPRQAMLTPAGLERVKGLLREYEAGESDMAASQGRGTVSYQFLWDALGVAR